MFKFMANVITFFSSKYICESLKIIGFICKKKEQQLMLVYLEPSWSYLMECVCEKAVNYFLKNALS